MLYNMYLTNVNLLSNIKVLKCHIDSRVGPGEKNACWQNVSYFQIKPICYITNFSGKIGPR